jgi:hypothetical protein
MTNAQGNPHDEIRNGSHPAQDFVIRALALIRHSSLELRHF